MSSKKEKSAMIYNKICKEIDNELMDKFGCIRCSSCGKLLVNGFGQSVTSWGHSHNLPRGRFPEYELDKDNISPRCQNFNGEKGCHEKLDSCDFSAISKFMDLKKIMEYRKNKNLTEYNKFVSGLLNVGCKLFKYENNSR